MFALRLPKPNAGSQSAQARVQGRAVPGSPRQGFGRPRGRRAFLGVDIDATAVKLVELSRPPAPSAGAHAPRRCGMEPLPPGAVETAAAGATVNDPDAVGEAIRRLRARIGTKARPAALAVPHAAAVRKTLRLDAGIGDDELEVEVALEAERHLPFPPEETALDFEPSHLCLDDPALVEVDVVACRLSHVRQREAAAAAGGLKAVVVEVDTMALARAARRLRAESSADAGADAPLLLAVLAATTTTVLAVNDDAVTFARQEPAEASRTTGEAGATAEVLVRQLARLLHLGFAVRGVDAPTRLMLLGDRAATPGLAALAAERLGLAVQVVDPLPESPAGPTAHASSGDGPGLVTAYGLALRGWTAGRSSDVAGAAQ